MMMVESRGFVADVESARKLVEGMGGSLCSHYAFSDILFRSVERIIDLRCESLRLRVYEHNEWPVKNSYSRISVQSGRRVAKVTSLL